jgi:DNA-binding LytR/AlgR family response regulator
MTAKTKTVYFKSRDELLRVDLTSIIYFEADGNYTKFVSANGLTSMVFISLGSLENLLSLRYKDTPGRFARVGKSYIVNLNYIYRINTLKQELIMSDQRTFTQTISMSKIALKNLKELLSPTNKTDNK